MIQNNKNFHDTISDLEEELESKINSVVSVNTKYRESQDKIDKLNRLFGHEKKEIRRSINLINELLTKLDLGTFTIDPKLCQKLDNVELLSLINNAIRAINNKLWILVYYFEWLEFISFSCFSTNITKNPLNLSDKKKSIDLNT